MNKTLQAGLQSREEPRIFRVAEITRLIKSVLEDEIGEVWIEGELSNFRKPASGHFYFTLKDDSAQIAAVMFRRSQRGPRFQPVDGQLIRVFGPVSVYEKSGQYQVVVRQMEMGGQGALRAAFEALKKKLAAEGLFDAARKKALPITPQNGKRLSCWRPIRTPSAWTASRPITANGGGWIRANTRVPRKASACTA